MAEERLETAVASEHAPVPAPAPQKEASPWSKERGTRIFRIITMIALPLLWIGFFYALYAGNEGTMSSYSLLILMFSLLNADVLVKGEKLPNKALNVLAKVNAVLLCTWAVVVIVRLLMG